MSNWDGYQREERTRLEPGNYRVCITGVEEGVSKKGNNMIILSVRPSGSNITIKHYIVKNEYFNRNMTDFFDSFDVPDGDFTFAKWLGAMGAAHLVEDEQGYLKVRYFIDRKKAEALPAWEGGKPERQEVTTLPDDDELPFL